MCPNLVRVFVPRTCNQQNADICVSTQEKYIIKKWPTARLRYKT
jgi:hypothetical protein